MPLRSPEGIGHASRRPDLTRARRNRSGLRAFVLQRHTRWARRTDHDLRAFRWSAWGTGQLGRSSNGRMQPFHRCDVEFESRTPCWMSAQTDVDRTIAIDRAISVEMSPYRNWRLVPKTSARASGLQVQLLPSPPLKPEGDRRRHSGVVELARRLILNQERGGSIPSAGTCGKLMPA